MTESSGRAFDVLPTLARNDGYSFSRSRCACGCKSWQSGKTVVQ